MLVKAILMAGGAGKRLRPLTATINKHLIKIENKPMLFYSLNTLIKLGIKDILIICNTNDISAFKRVIKKEITDRKINIIFKTQKNLGGGIAEGLNIGKSFAKNSDKLVLMLGDNFFSKNITLIKKKIFLKTNKSTLVLKKVHYKAAKNFGIAVIKNKKIEKIIEKPKKFISNMAITGIYIYNSHTLKFAKNLMYSKRKELEISAFNQILLKKDLINQIILPKKVKWVDMGTFENLKKVENLVKKN